MIFHVTTIGYREGAIRLERHIEAADERKAAQTGLWLSETIGIAVNSVIARPKQPNGWGAIKVFARDDLRAPFYGAEIASMGAVINAKHLPADERQDLTQGIETREIPGMIGPGCVAVLASQIDPLTLEDDLPILSTLVQIARDEGIDWIVMDVDGPFLEEGSTYPE